MDRDYPEAYKKDDEISKYLDEQLDEVAKIISKVQDNVPQAYYKHFILMVKDYINE